MGIDPDQVTLIGPAGIITDPTVELACCPQLDQPVVPGSVGRAFRQEVFELAVDPPAVFQLAIKLDGKGEIGQLGIAPLELDAGTNMARPAVVSELTDRAGEPASRSIRRFAEHDRRTAQVAVFRGRSCWMVGELCGVRGRSRSRARQWPVRDRPFTAWEFGADIGVNRRPTALDKDRDHVGRLEKAGIITLAIRRFGQQGGIGLRQISPRSGRKSNQRHERSGQDGPCAKSHHINPDQPRPGDRSSSITGLGNRS